MPILSYIEQQKGDVWINTLSTSLIFVCSVPLTLALADIEILVGNIFVAVCVLASRSVWKCVLSLWLRTRRLLSPVNYWLFVNYGAMQWKAIGEKVKNRCGDEEVHRWKRQKKRKKEDACNAYMKKFMIQTHENLR